MKTINVVSLGCAKNLVDSERLLGSAIRNLGLKPVAAPEEADLILVNTCAFLTSAVGEAVEAVMELGRAKKPGARLAVCGCLPARYTGAEGAEMALGLPEVDLWLPPNEYPNFEKLAGELLQAKAKAGTPSFSAQNLPLGGRVQATPPFRAFLKIAEGCDNRCTYCLIPKLRGPLTSYAPDFLAAEAEQLAAGGVRELTLVAQDLTAYGFDREDKGALVKLLRRLSGTPVDWLRLLYAYPERLTERLVKELASIPKVLPYLDLPFQHVSPAVLKRMGRRQVLPPLELVEKLRRWWPGLALRTTLIVGFPGETEEDFQDLLRFVREAAIEHLGVFKFSPESGAPAAALKNQVPQHVKEKRRRKVMAEQRKISLAGNRRRVGQTVQVLVEGPSEESELVMTGRASFQAPEVDGLIYFDGEQPAPGELVDVQIVKAFDYDLLGRVAE
ncbi:MAG: 30S ribosomal protein S12 methylthiotransferase RimO [Candidatus Adiutrix sp.]|jgi:ribosomal protein S12 methylthiotransferase|nr:30S ribosomal protein S12 methylthiotransferase RimO [Candidatus Adiutrix sp.]